MPKPLNFILAVVLNLIEDGLELAYIQPSENIFKQAGAGLYQAQTQLCYNYRNIMMTS